MATDPTNSPPFISLTRWRGALAWSAFILILTSVPLPAPPGPGTGLPLDKVIHAVLYAGLGWHVFGGLTAGKRQVGASLVAAAALVALLFGAADELHQAWIPTRHPSLGDWVADAAGGIVGALAAAWRTARNGGARP